MYSQPVPYMLIQSWKLCAWALWHADTAQSCMHNSLYYLSITLHPVLPGKISSAFAILTHLTKQQKQKQNLYLREGELAFEIFLTMKQILPS